MKVSNTVKRNLYATLFAVGVCCTIGRAWEAAISPESVKVWLKLIGTIAITFLCFDDFRIYQRRLKSGILFGNQKLDNYKTD